MNSKLGLSSVSIVLVLAPLAACGGGGDGSRGGGGSAALPPPSNPAAAPPSNSPAVATPPSNGGGAVGGATSKAWGTAALIETDNGSASDPQIAVDANGNALAIWQQWDGTRNNIWANRFQ